MTAHPLITARVNVLLGFAGCTDMYRKLRWEIDTLRQAIPGGLPEVRYHALNCAITAWHMSDWVWRDMSQPQRDALSDEAGRKLGDVGSFQNFLTSTDRTFHLCRQVATTGKHMEMDYKTDPTVKADVSLTYSVSRRQPGAVVLGPLRPVIWDGTTKLQGIEVFKAAARYWRALLEKHGLIESEFVGRGVADDLASGGED